MVARIGHRNWSAQPSQSRHCFEAARATRARCGRLCYARWQVHTSNREGLVVSKSLPILELLFPLQEVQRPPRWGICLPAQEKSEEA